MRLEKASYKAIKYACLNFHYAKALPVNVFGYSVFNDNNEWCGVVLYGSGASANIGKPYGLGQGEVIELVRMALNGKQGITTKVMALSMKLIKKDAPLCKMLISYADKWQGHYGIIYQATNWFFIGNSQAQANVLDPITGQELHKRSAVGKYGSCKGLKYGEIKYKYKYIYPLNKTLIPLCESLKKPYPKIAQEVNQDKRDASSIEIGGSNPTLALNSDAINVN